VPFRLFLLGSAILLSGAAVAQEPQAPPERASSLIVYGDDPCPQASEDEIVICARRPDSERYRIPKELREAERDPAQQSWASRVDMLEDISRQNIPGGCSVVGSYGQSGCWQQMMRQWQAARREAKRQDEREP
jgi:hypothetical protein